MTKTSGISIAMLSKQSDARSTALKSDQEEVRSREMVVYIYTASLRGCCTQTGFHLDWTEANNIA